jgi:signal-transduction protein with cAMP-binding, CBS, and nucleotidyltransferase domain
MNKFQVFFSQIKEEGFLREIVTRMNPKLFFCEQKIVKRGTPARGLYFMLQGSVKVSYIGHAICILPENSFFGDSFILGQNSDLDYV